MPRQIDPEVEGRILQAARQLWHKGGEAALRMREVAKAAGTNTPAVYRRFRTREELLYALVNLFLDELIEGYRSCNSLSEALECLLGFALQNPREYQLIMSGLLAKMTKERKGFQFVVDRTAEWMGGSPRQRKALVLSLYALGHGLAMLRISGTLRDQDFPSARAGFKKSLQILIANAEQLRGL